MAIKQARLRFNGAQATNHQGGGQGKPFHISASPRKV
jgi:hypothetical protein